MRAHRRKLTLGQDTSRVAPLVRGAVVASARSDHAQVAFEQQRRGVQDHARVRARRYSAVCSGRWSSRPCRCRTGRDTAHPESLASRQPSGREPAREVERLEDCGVFGRQQAAGRLYPVTGRVAKWRAARSRPDADDDDDSPSTQQAGRQARGRVLGHNRERASTGCRGARLPCAAIRRRPEPRATA